MLTTVDKFFAAAILMAARINNPNYTGHLNEDPEAAAAFVGEAVELADALIAATLASIPTHNQPAPVPGQHRFASDRPIDRAWTLAAYRYLVGQGHNAAFQRAVWSAGATLSVIQAGDIERMAIDIAAELGDGTASDPLGFMERGKAQP